MTQADPVLRPLVVDLDGALLRSDLLYETFFGSLGPGKIAVGDLVRSCLRGRAALKTALARSCPVDYATLPYDPIVLNLIAAARAEGRSVYLATASDQSHAEGVAAQLGLFDGVFGSDGDRNLKGVEKARELVDVFGERGFDYLGDSHDDLHVWRHAARAYEVRASAAVRRKLAEISPDAVHLESRRAPMKTWAKALRVHQYAKNLLLFVPMFTAHRIDPWTFLDALTGVVAFSLCASSVYLLNDLADLRADRAHPSKRLRPFASGDLPIAAAGIVVPGLLVAACAIGSSISWAFLGTLLAYFVLTTAYTFWLKSKMFVDVVVLAVLYTIRIVAGGVATGVVLSEWLLAFSTFIFMSLALMKRYVELATLVEKDLPDPSSRNYRRGDLPIVGALAAACSMNSVTIFALYLSSSPMIETYSRPWALWLICPLLLYWLGRALMMAHRRTMDDDPVVFALRDKVSRLALVCMVLLVLVAM